MDRDVLGLAERLASGVEQRRRAVAPLLDVGGMRGADQRLAGFVDDRGQGSADDFAGDGVETTLPPYEVGRWPKAGGVMRLHRRLHDPSARCAGTSPRLARGASVGRITPPPGSN